MRRSERNRVFETILVAFDETEVSISDPTILLFPELEIKLNEQMVYQDGEAVPLTRKEFAVLDYLARHPQWVFSAERIYEAIWNEDGENCGTAVVSIIGQIRRKLTPKTPKGGYIQTVAGSGYKFVIPK